eukprot:5069914-Pyramimonas_sp.AAC.1
MDDSSFQWARKRLSECDVLLAAVHWYCEQLFHLGPMLQVLKSGSVATAATASSRVSPSARILKLRIAAPTCAV